jgi:hypothetical protein
MEVHDDARHRRVNLISYLKELRFLSLIGLCVLSVVDSSGNMSIVKEMAGVIHIPRLKGRGE